jgi:threonine aldolase
MNKLEIDEDGLYINASNYFQAKESVIISKIRQSINENIDREIDCFLSTNGTNSNLVGIINYATTSDSSISE